MLLHRKVELKFIILDEEKLMWAFRLYDLGNKNLYFFYEILSKFIKKCVDNNGEIDIEEMANIIETLDCIEGVQAGCVRYDENGHPVDTPSAKTRAEDLFMVDITVTFDNALAFNGLFKAIDKSNKGSLTLEEFLSASSRMSEIIKRQDAMEQKKKLSCLLFMSPVIQKHNDFSKVYYTLNCQYEE